MKKLKIILLIILLIIILGIFIPKIFISDSYQLSQDDYDTIVSANYQLLDNPIERILIQQIVIDNRAGNIISTSVYTFWGVKYATIETDFDGSARVTWRRWFK